MRVVFTQASLRDLNRIRNYIAKESGSPEVADRYVGRIFNACEALNYSSESYSVYRYAAKWRMTPFEKYLVLFRVLNGEVKIGRVRHGARRVFRG